MGIFDFLKKGKLEDITDKESSQDFRECKKILNKFGRERTSEENSFLEEMGRKYKPLRDKKYEYKVIYNMLINDLKRNY